MTRKCNLRCIYCSTNAGEARENEMGLNAYLDLLDKCRQLGATTLSIEGEGEPLLDKNLIPVLKRAKDLAMRAVVFTNGTLITEKKASLFRELDTSFIVKLNSLNPALHDDLTGSRGSFQKAFRGLRILMDYGFNSPRIDKGSADLYTRLGIETIICKKTLTEIPQLVRFAKRHNLYPVLDMIEYEGRAAGEFYKNQRITPEENRAVFEQVRKIMGYQFLGPMGPQCPQLISFNVTNTGEVRVSACGGSCSVEPGRLIGNVQTESVGELYKQVRELREKTHLVENIEAGLLRLEGYEMFPQCPIQVRLLQVHDLPPSDKSVTREN